MYVQWLFVVGMAAVVHARDCLTSEAMENFEMSKYEGIWYNLAKMENKTNAPYKNEYTCVSLNFKTVGDFVDCYMSFLSKGIRTIAFGQFTLVDNAKGLFSINVTQFPPAFVNQFHKVLCTDYNTYAVVYSSTQYEAGHCLEYATFNGRDRTKFEEIATNEDVKKCIQDKLQTSLDQFKRLPVDDCHLFF